MLHEISLNGFREEEGKKWELFEQCPLALFIPCLGWWKCQQTILPKPLPVSQAFPGSQDPVLWCGAFPLLHTYKEWWERLSSCGIFLQGKNYRVIIWEMKDYRTSFLNGDTDTERLKGPYQIIFDASPLAEIAPVFYKCC